LGLAPPVSTEAHRYVFMGALQFSLFALVVPALFVLAAPWKRFGSGGVVGAFAARRKRHTGFVRALAVLVCSQVVLFAWRTPVAVNALVHHGFFAPLELVTLVLAGSALWLELVESPPFSPRSPRQRRIVIAAFAMWTMWTIAYLVGLSHNGWYSAYANVSGRVVSVAADQQIMAGLLWAVAAFTFLPVIFFNLMAWLRDEQDPDEELASLTREERRRQRWHANEVRSGESA
jgi:cytochrome c oxidase assembly factor CtaG